VVAAAKSDSVAVAGHYLGGAVFPPFFITRFGVNVTNLRLPIFIKLPGKAVRAGVRKAKTDNTNIAPHCFNPISAQRAAVADFRPGVLPEICQGRLSVRGL
jgi:hypothetical protein